MEKEYNEGNLQCREKQTNVTNVHRYLVSGGSSHMSGGPSVNLGGEELLTTVTRGGSGVPASASSTVLIHTAHRHCTKMSRT